MVTTDLQHLPLESPDEFPSARYRASSDEELCSSESRRDCAIVRVADVGGAELQAGEACIGLADYQVRSDLVIRRHWVLVWCAFSFCWWHLAHSAGEEGCSSMVLATTSQSFAISGSIVGYNGKRKGKDRAETVLG